jgi:hypothetical protein
MHDAFEGGFRVGEELVHRGFVDRWGVLRFWLPSLVLHEQPHCRQERREPVFVAREWFTVSACALKALQSYVSPEELQRLALIKDNADLAAGIQLEKTIA